MTARFQRPNWTYSFKNVVVRISGFGCRSFSIVCFVHLFLLSSVAINEHILYAFSIRVIVSIFITASASEILISD